MTDTKCLYNTRIKYFPDCQKLTCFSKPIFNPYKHEKIEKNPKEKQSIYVYNLSTGKRELREIEGLTALNPFTGKVTRLGTMEEKIPRYDSVKRAKDKAFEISSANEFNYFLTLTLSTKKIGDRTSPEVIYPKLKNWLSNMVQRHEMQYIVFPEYHKKIESATMKRAIHFHGLIKATGLNLVDSGKRTKDGKTIYNLDNWKYGWSTVIECDQNVALRKYVTKYCTKGNYKILGKFYLSGGKGLIREVPTEYMNIDYSLIEAPVYKIPNTTMCVKYFNTHF